MSVKKILTEPNKMLRQVSKNVEKVDNVERELMDDMLDTMYFIISTLNQLNIDPIRNKILLKILPLKV